MTKEEEDEIYPEKNEILKYVFIGLMVGLIYCKLVYPMKEFGRLKYFNFTFGPFRNGKLYIKNYHIHHWLVFLIIIILMAIALLIFPSQIKNYIEIYSVLIGISVIMIGHGLSYKDAFDFRS